MALTFFLTLETKASMWASVCYEQFDHKLRRMAVSQIGYGEK